MSVGILSLALCSCLFLALPLVFAGHVTYIGPQLSLGPHNRRYIYVYIYIYRYTKSNHGELTGLMSTPGRPRSPREPHDVYIKPSGRQMVQR